MSVRVTSTEGVVALYDSTTDIAFGPIFGDEEDANDFLEWLDGRDPRRMTAAQLAQEVASWRDEKSDG